MTIIPQDAELTAHSIPNGYRLHYRRNIFEALHCPDGCTCGRWHLDRMDAAKPWRRAEGNRTHYYRTLADAKDAARQQIDGGRK